MKLRLLIVAVVLMAMASLVCLADAPSSGWRYISGVFRPDWEEYYEKTGIPPYVPVLVSAHPDKTLTIYLRLETTNRDLCGTVWVDRSPDEELFNASKDLPVCSTGKFRNLEQWQKP